MRSTTTLTIRVGGCGMTIAQRSPASLAATLMGEIAIIGTFSSLAIGTMALVEAAVEVPISRSTLFSSTSLRALRVAADGSEPSSSWISLIFSAPMLLAYSTAAFMPRS